MINLFINDHLDDGISGIGKSEYLIASGISPLLNLSKILSNTSLTLLFIDNLLSLVDFQLVDKKAKLRSRQIHSMFLNLLVDNCLLMIVLLKGCYSWLLSNIVTAIIET